MFYLVKQKDLPLLLTHRSSDSYDFYTEAFEESYQMHAAKFEEGEKGTESLYKAKIITNKMMKFFRINVISRCFRFLQQPR